MKLKIWMMYVSLEWIHFQLDMFRLRLILNNWILMIRINFPIGVWQLMWNWNDFVLSMFSEGTRCFVTHWSLVLDCKMNIFGHECSMWIVFFIFQNGGLNPTPKRVKLVLWNTILVIIGQRVIGISNHSFVVIKAGLVYHIINPILDLKRHFFLSFMVYLTLSFSPSK